MGLFVVTFLVMTICVAAMAIGVMFGRRPIAGSCGGLNVDGSGKCQSCARPCKQARNAMSASQVPPLDSRESDIGNTMTRPLLRRDATSVRSASRKQITRGN